MRISSLILISIFSIMPYSWLQAQNPTVIYIGDPMCSWCYGFAPEITQLRESLPNYEFKVVLGGLRPGGTETNADLGEFLAQHWKDVEKRTGQPFNYDVLKKPSTIYDTEPACRAVVVARKMNPEIELEFFKAVQTAFYVTGSDMLSAETYAALAQEFGLDKNQFKTLFESDELKYDTKADFQLASEMGVQGFPSVVMRYNGKFHMIANGYTTAEALMKVIAKVESED